MSTRQTTTSVSGGLSTEQVMSLLQHEHRRAIVAYFAQASTESVSFDDLIDYLVTLDSKRNGVESTKRRQRMTIDLLHNHLPRLADADVLEYDQRSKTIRYCDSDRLKTLVEFTRREDNTT
jgi:hypothetical protein